MSKSWSEIIQGKGLELMDDVDCYEEGVEKSKVPEKLWVWSDDIDEGLVHYPHYYMGELLEDLMPSNWDDMCNPQHEDFVLDGSLTWAEIKKKIVDGCSDDPDFNNDLKSRFRHR
jgi:hypothetical protein